MTFRSRDSALLLLSVILLGTGASSGNTQVSGNAGAVRPLAVDAGGDTCAAATTIPSVPFNDTGDTTGATDNIRLTGCVGLSLEGPDLVYAFNVFAGNNLTFTLTPSALDPDYDPAIYIRTACAQGSGTCVARQDVGGNGQAETITVSNLAPGTYYFFIDSIYPADDVSGMGRYSLSVTGTLGVPNNTSFYTLTPCRILDTRLANGPYGGPVLAGSTARTFTLTGQCGIPPTAKSVSVNATVTEPTGQGHLTLYPGGTSQPATSTLNYRAGQTRANNAIVPLGAGGTVSVFCGLPVGGSAHFLLDVNGYFQ